MSRAREFADLASSADAGGLTGRNIIINGAMQVAQRATSVASLSSTATYSTCDRWQVQYGSSGTFTESQSTTAPDGFSNSLKFDCTTADASPNYLVLDQRIEGQNLQNLKKGTSSALSTTVSFYVRSSKTGTYQVNLRDLDNDRMIGATYAISSANTWEFKSITFAGDTTGAFDNDNASSLSVEWWLAAGSTYNSGAVPTAWEATSNGDRAAGLNVAIGASTSDDFHITGVQFEVGQKATPFEHRPFADELRRCQRYYQKHGNETTAYRFLASAFCNATTQAQGVLTLPVTMRAAPSASVSGNFEMIHKNLNSSITLGTKQLNPSSVGLEPSGSSFTQSSGAIIRGSNDATAQLKLDAEL